MIDKKLLEKHGLTFEEYNRIVDLIGKEPSYTELGIFSLMWSEHCSYKSSKVHLKKLPVTGENVIQGPGENAGIIDIGDGMAAVFKIESHNHPSFIEPYQGAATGVGGILRDIFTMGARPIALMNSLRFGPLSNSHNRSIMDGVVSGIAGYGNCMGVPTVGGEIYFHNSYALNPLVNVFCLGIAEHDKIFYAKAEGTGNPVLYIGSKTGRDGIHGATMASAEFGEDLEEKRPNVQVGDPFKEKLLLEACLEVMNKGLIVGIQDMGAAGLTCSSSEMASNSGTGIEINLDLVPQREEGMTPYEIMLSESQERMLLVATDKTVKEVQEIFAKWDLEAVIIGHVTDGNKLKVKAGGEIVVDVPVDAIINSCPVYNRQSKKPAYLSRIRNINLPEPPEDYNQVFLRLLSQPTIANKEWVYRQYDHMVQINTVFFPGAGASLLRLKGKNSALALTLDGNAVYCYLDPRTGGKIAVAEACRNLACIGARPLGVTNCLNFGNPEKPEIMWQFIETVEGIAEACKVFSIPVTGGNVSFYNETEGTPIFPTPVLGIVGIVDDFHKAVSQGFKNEGDIILLLGKTKEELNGTEYFRVIHRKEEGTPPQIDLAEEKKVQDFCIEAASKELIASANDISEGGLAVCLAESAFSAEAFLGCTVSLKDSIRTDALFFGETQSRIIVTVEPENLDTVLDLAGKRNIPITRIGKVNGQKIFIRHSEKSCIKVPVALAYNTWKNAIPKIFQIKS